MVDTAGTGSPDLKHEAGAAAHRVADTAEQEARSVGHEAKDRARRLADRVGDEVRSQASTQQHRAAGGIRGVGEQFSRMASSSESDGMAREIVGTVGDRAERAAAWLDRREPGDLVEELKRFARRRPGAFLAIAAGAGVLVGRFTRSLASDANDDADARRLTTDEAGRTQRDRLEYGTDADPYVDAGAYGPAGTGAHVAGDRYDRTSVTDTRPQTSVTDTRSQPSPLPAERMGGGGTGGLR
ncbi:hypothetical protein [Agromyces sp. ZXT2-3]|uniref:hypothetical protein n=1 Tax=Agromyces sp. ZXT2-3 TaxID=3461152 RepID=UPI0040551E1D